MTNRINPNEKDFVTDIKDKDRFKDISVIIYEQNSKLYRMYYKNMSNETLDKLALCSSSLNELDIMSNQESIDKLKKQNQRKNNSTETKICSIL
jgi:hypothetical protein